MVPATALVDQRGRAFTLQDFKGQTLVVSFVYTRCRDANECPLVSAKLSRVQRSLAGTPIHIVELTLDPLHDSPAVLARYGALFGSDPQRWQLATGAAPALAELETRLGVNATAKGDAIEHTEAVVFVDPRGRIADRLVGSAWSAGDVLSRARGVAGLGVNPLANLRLALTRGIDAVCGGGTSGISLAIALALFLALLAAIGYVVARAFRAGSGKLRKNV